MQAWQEKLRGEVVRALSTDGGLSCPENRIHLAILTEPYLEWILSGKKTVESRFSIHRVPPFGVVSPGDAFLS